MIRHSLVASWILLFFAPVNVLGCTCRTPTPAPCSQSEASIVFVGTVIDIANPSTEDPGTHDSIGLTRYRFQVDESLAGIHTTGVDVYSDGSTCSYEFRQ